ncbi:MAG: GGDEF domain-containing protein [Hyphomonadaceae bacterium]
MFRQLRLKLTVLYAGLFGLALLAIGVSACLVVERNAADQAQRELRETGEIFGRYWNTRLAQLNAASWHYAEEHDLASAVLARTDGAITARLAEIERRTSTDLAIVVTPEGLVISENGARSSVPPMLQIALQRGRVEPGILTLGDDLYQAVAVPLREMNTWLVVGNRLDDDSVDGFRDMASIPLEIDVGSQQGGRLALDSSFAEETVAALVDDAMVTDGPVAQSVQDARGQTFVSISRLPSLDGTEAFLIVSSPLNAGLAPYTTLLGALLLIGIAGMLFVTGSAWMLARGVTQPIQQLQRAAQKLSEGAYEVVTIKTHDELSGLADTFNAMAGAIRERERRITQLAFHDGETRLPNRVALERKLTATARRERLYLAAIGVDRFTHVRGAIGYSLASELVRQLGGRLAHLAPNAPMARLASDVLGVAFIATSEADALKRARALIANLEQPVSLDGQVVDVHVTIGIAQPGGKQETSSAMIERASIALDQTRQRGQKAGMYDETAYGDPARNLSLMGEMSRALESGAIYLAHQPKYNFRTGRIDSVECLVRWRHPVRGAIAPDLFVPMAEETGHIRALTEWVLERAIISQKALHAAGYSIEVAVNISARLLSDTDFAKRAAALARQAPNQVSFEITETAIIDNPVAALENIERFASNGVHVAIDDYGSGLSSLAYLKQLPAQELKIDKIFVQNITSSQRDALLVRSTIDLAHGLGMNVTAEGVETPAAFALLASLNCDLAQGYLISRPCSLEELMALLGDDRRLQYYKQTALGATPSLAVAPQQPKHA